MENIKCKQCGSIAVKRKGSEFCSVRCKNNYWNSLKTKKTDIHNSSTDNQVTKTENKSVSIPNLEQIPPKRIVEKFKTETFAYVVGNSQLNKLKTKQQEVIQAIEKKTQQLQSTQISTKLESIAIGAMAGSAKGVIGMGLGAVGGILVDKWLNKQQVKEQPTLTIEINQLKQVLSDIDRQIAQKEQELKTIPQYQVMERLVANPAYMVYQLRKRVEQDKEQQRKAKEAAIKKKQEQERLEREKQSQEERQRLIAELESQDTTPINENTEQPQEPPQQPKHRIISSKELCKMNFPTLDFQGAWLDFMGKPETDSCIITHGRPGCGKTSFTILLAKYLAVKFGKVIIVTKEEGFGETLKVKMKRFKAEVDNIDIANFISLEQIYENIPQDGYNFIVLDSLGKLEIDEKALEQLRKHYSNSLIIAIAQSTKDGKAKGSNELLHDCDIEISVTNGVATTIKNRFQETGREYKIF